MVTKSSCLHQLLIVSHHFILIILCCLSFEMLPPSGFPTVGFWSSLQKKARCTCLTGLETTLRNFSCLSAGDSIMVAYNNRKYYIDIIDTKPSNAISIIETDCEVDFAPPLDFKEPEKPVVSIPTGKSPAEGLKPPAEAGPKFNPFTGVARRLDGRPLQTQPPPVTSNVRTDAPTASGQASTSSSSSLSKNRLSQGRLVFGSTTDRSHEASKDTSKGPKEEPPRIEGPKFEAFSGKKYSLKGLYIRINLIFSHVIVALKLLHCSKLWKSNSY